MSFLDHIKQCNHYNPLNYMPFLVNGIQYGWAKKEFVEQLKTYDKVFAIESDCLTLNPALSTCEERSAAIKPVLEQLHKGGVIDTWVNELYAITNHFGDEPAVLIERASVSYFGARGYGVHINGLVEKNDGVYIWIAKRAKDKPFWPGSLDQIVAGGQPAGISLIENVIKESAEEAAIPESISAKAELMSEIHYRGETHSEKNRGLNVDTLFNYDLWLPDDFTPVNTDGEVDEFILMSLEEMADITDTSNDFKANCNLVNIDLLIRRGLISESHPDYNEITQLLYAPAAL